MYSAAASGSLIPDEIYVSLITAKLETVSAQEQYRGFVIEDFPRTQKQASLLITVSLYILPDSMLIIS